MDVFNIDDYSDEETWDLISDGRTKGVFQLESKLGSTWAKKTSPRSIEELAALVSIIRPGVLNAELDGKSMAHHYADRKSGKDEVKYIDQSLEPILNTTCGIIVYQEQNIRIAMDIAGFTPEEGDMLRRSMGKKDASLMKEVRIKFIEGCEKKGIVDSKIAEQIFDWIETSNRYGFNKCISPDTQVRTRTGKYITIKDIEIGEFIESPDGFVEVVDKYNNGVHHLFELTLQNNNTITCTINHKFLCRDGYIRPLYQIIIEDSEIVCRSSGSYRIFHIELVGEKPTMDIEVKSDDHIFYGNDIATSNSHAVAYAINAFRSAYCKTHDPFMFYTTYLNYAHYKPKKYDEVKQLIMDAKVNNIDIIPPRLSNFYSEFTPDKDKSVIYYGYSSVKNVGEGEQANIKNIIMGAVERVGKDVSLFNWVECLFFISPKVKSNSFQSLIKVGAFVGKNNKLSRNKMLYDFDIFKQLTPNELKVIEDGYNKLPNGSFEELLAYVINNHKKVTAKRLKVLTDFYNNLLKPPYSLDDDPVWIANMEEELLGTALTCSHIDMAASDGYTGNISCIDIVKGEGVKNDSAQLCVKINYCKGYKLTKGKNIGRYMGFISAEDSTGCLDDIAIFCDEYDEFKNLLYNGNTVMLIGSTDKKKPKSFVVKKVIQI